MEKLGKYELREVLGRGGMGVVYRAFDPLMDREVAIKVILEKSLESQETKARFIREARTAGKLSHDNITVIHDYGEFEGKTFIVMEFLDGKDLRSIIDTKEPLTLRDKLSYARQVCRGLQYAHANMIVHRDIKPENIKVLADGRIKIMDFGIAKPYSPTAVAMEVDTQQVLTQIGMRIGTPWYMSPEQVKGDPVEKRADIFSFGVVLYELLTYKKPFTGNDTTVMYKILHEEPDPIQLEESGLTVDLQKILTQCLAKDPAARYADCLLLLRDLESILDRVAQTRNVKKLLSEGEQLTQQRRFEEATVKFNEVLDLDPGNEVARFSIKKMSEEHKESATLRVLTGNIVGEIISHFRILEKIGGGGMGVVYKAEDITLKRVVALKFLPPDRTRDPLAKKRFLKEAQAASALDHPSICAIHEISETEDGLIFICMAYYGGENLSKKIMGGPLEVNDALEFAIKIARGLAKAHEHGIVHRDIKPANIIITPDNDVKIVDFGLVKLTGATRITRIGSAMGTVPFMSPEQVKGLDQDHRTDIWSLGVLLYEILTGKLPFMGDHETAIMYSIVNENQTPASKVRTGLPPGLEDAIQRSLRKEPDERYPSMRDLLNALEEIHRDVVRPHSLELARSAELTRLVDNGNIYFKKREYQEALTRYEAALKLSPDDARIHELRAVAGKKMEEAKHLETMVIEARAFMVKGKVRDAKEVLNTVLEVHPQHATASELLGQAQQRIDHEEGLDKLIADGAFYLKHEKFAEAAGCYRKALAIDPANKEASRGLKRVDKESENKPRRDRTPTPVPVPASLRSRRVLVVGLPALVLIGGVVAVIVLRSPEPAVVQKPAEEPPPVAVDSSGLVNSARQGMLNRKGLAVEAKAERWAPEQFVAALQTERQAGKDFEAGRFTAAERGFARAEVSFGDAIDAAHRNEAASITDVGDLRTLVAAAQKDMKADRATAERAGGKAMLRAAFNGALGDERQGDRLAQTETRESLLAARDAYTNARSAYRKVATDASALASLRREADGRKADMTAAKQTVRGLDREKDAAPSYRPGLNLESQGVEKYSSGDFKAAGDAFDQAGRLYASAAGEILAARKAAAPIVEAEKKEADLKTAPPKEKLDRDAARRDIQHLIDTYRASLEQGNLENLTALLNLGGDKRNEWSAFFGASEDRKVSVEGVEMDVQSANARVTFRVRMSFFNRAANTTQNVENPRQWTLAPADGTWKIVSQK